MVPFHPLLSYFGYEPNSKEKSQIRSHKPQKKRPTSSSFNDLFSGWRTNRMCPAIWLFDAVCCCLILAVVPYTEIDWTTYMQQIAKFFDGQELDYSKIEGDTGPLVYPAGHVWVYGLLRRLTFNGTNIMMAQIIFAAIYLAQLALVLNIFRRSNRMEDSMPRLQSICVGEDEHVAFCTRATFFTV
eukprot:Selendium_serpulae@DN5261_c0_g1_i2.p2